MWSCIRNCYERHMKYQFGYVIMHKYLKFHCFLEIYLSYIWISVVQWNNRNLICIILRPQSKLPDWVVACSSHFGSDVHSCAIQAVASSSFFCYFHHSHCLPLKRLSWALIRPQPARDITSSAGAWNQRALILYIYSMSCRNLKRPQNKSTRAQIRRRWLAVSPMESILILSTQRIKNSLVSQSPLQSLTIR